MAWLEVCAAGAIDEDDVMRFDQGDQSFAVYRRTEDDYCATDGLCTHEAIHLADRLVMDGLVECPKRSGRFDDRTCVAKGLVCINLRTYPVTVEDGKI